MSNPKPSTLDLCLTTIHQVSADFARVSVDPTNIVFAREAEFAMQHLGNNSFVAEKAMENPVSLQNAIVNVAALGISLNPAKKHAYLVPRKVDQRSAVCLDISYMGLMAIAMDGGGIVWAQAKLVYEGDTYRSNGLDKAPTHEYDPFGGNSRSVQAGFKGVYVTIKLEGGDYLTHEMDAASVLDIMARSESVKAGRRSPWKTDFGEMAKKTCVKQAQKYWPKNDRLAAAIHHLDTTGDGIDFSGHAAAEPTRPEASEMAMGYVEEAHEIAKASTTEEMAEPWGKLSDRIRTAVNNQMVKVEVFHQCKAIIAARVEAIKAHDKNRTIDA